MFSSLEHFHSMCDKFLSEGISNFTKFQSALSTKNHECSFKIKQLALTIHFLGPEVYNFIKKLLYLPSPRSLQKITDNWEIRPGLNDFLFNVLGLKAKSLKPKSKECILSISEMCLKKFLFYNFEKDEIVGFQDTGLWKSSDLAKSVMVAMIHGLHDSWKQPFSYFFTASAITGFDLQNIIFKCIKQLNSITFNVKVMISNLNSNLKQFVDLQCITSENPYFNVEGKEVVFMFDSFDLLNETRNNFFNYRFKSGTKIATKTYLTDFYDIDKSIIHRLAPKLTCVHINPNSSQKKCVKYAAQCFSHSVVTGMSVLVSLNKLSPRAIDTISFIDSIDKLFDIFNSYPISSVTSFQQESKRHRLPFKNSSFQKDFLNTMANYFKNLEIQKFNVIKNKWVNIKTQRFVNAWLISISGLNRLFHNLSYNGQDCVEICTFRLNQKYLNSFFENIRIENDCTKPTALQFKRSFKKLFCIYYFEHLEKANCNKDLYEIIVSQDESSIEEFKILFPEKKYKQHPLFIHDISNYKNLSLPNENALTYICGYLIGECLKVHKCKICLNFASAATYLSPDNFCAHFKAHEQDPSSVYVINIVSDSTFYQYIYQLFLVFKRNFMNLASHPNVGMNLRDSMMDSVFFYHPCKDFPKTFLINLFIRYRIFHTLNKTNKKCRVSSYTNSNIKEVELFV